MEVIYLDEVFALNAAADAFLLILTARLAGIRARFPGILTAAVSGGVYAACVPSFPFLTAAPVKLACGAGLALTAFGREERLFRLTALFFAVSCAFAGCVRAAGEFAGLYGTGALLWSGLCVWVVSEGLFRAAARRHTEGLLFPVRVRLGGRTAELTALWDSGNGLREDGQPVLVVSPEGLRGLVPAFVTAETLRTPADLVAPLMRTAPELRPRLIPYRTVGMSGLLLTVESEWAEIGGAGYPGLRVALSPTELPGCQALWGGPVRREGEGGRDERDLEAAAVPLRRTVLHRGQRHPAPAAEPGAGGGTACPCAGGGGAAGAD